LQTRPWTTDGTLPNISAVLPEESAPAADRSVGCLALFVWSCFGAPGTAALVAETLFRTLGLTSWTLIIGTLALVGLIGWLVFRSCRFGSARALVYTIVSLAVAVGLFALWAHSASGSL
jgi:hypothetical protein